MTVEPQDTPELLYARLGGWGGIAIIADLWCDRALAEAQLAPHFANVNRSTLRREQTDFLVHLAGGPVRAPAFPLPPLFAHLPASAGHAERLLGHLTAALVWANVPRLVIEEVLEAVGSVVPQHRPAEPSGDP
jgi:hemoglobin